MDDRDGDNRPYYAHIIGMSTASIHALALVSIPSPVLQGLEPSLGVLRLVHKERERGL